MRGKEGLAAGPDIYTLCSAYAGQSAFTGLLIFFIKKFHFKRVYHGAESLKRAGPDETAGTIPYIQRYIRERKNHALLYILRNAHGRR